MGTLVCAADDCSNSLDGRRRHAIYCSPRCQHYARRRRLGMREYDRPLSPYWREYLRRFDRALHERTPDAWAACHEMAPQGERRQIPPEPALAKLLRSLEA